MVGYVSVFSGRQGGVLLRLLSVVLVWILLKPLNYHLLFLFVLFRFKVRMSRKNLHFSSSSGLNFFPKMCLRNSSKRSQG